MFKSQPILDQVKSLRQQAEAKRIEAIEELLAQRDEIDRKAQAERDKINQQLAELEYSDIASPSASEPEPAIPGKRVRSEQTKLRMAAQYWLREGKNKPDGLKLALKERHGLAALMKQMKAEGSNGYSPRNKNMRRQGS